MFELICARFNQAVKLANSSKANIEDLLKTALTGDKESYLIFLDLFEEQNPVARKALAKATDLANIFNILHKNFPSIISKTPTNRFKFNPLLLGKIKSVGAFDSTVAIAYNDYDIEFILHPPNGTITFDNSQIVIRGLAVTYISVINNEIDEIRGISVNRDPEVVSSREMTRSLTHQQLDELFALFDEYREQAINDYSVIMELFN